MPYNWIDVVEGQVADGDAVNLMGNQVELHDIQLAQRAALISASILSAAAGSVSFSSIPATYSSLRLEIVCRSSVAAVSANLHVQFNGDTTANYDYQEMAGQQALTAAVEQLAQTAIPLREMTGASAPANHPGVFTIDIPWYSAATFLKLLNGQSSWSNGTATGSLVTRNFMGRWRSNAAITSITLLPSAGSFITGSSFALYGLP